MRRYKVLTLHGAMPKQTDFKQSLCVDIQGFSLRAAVPTSDGRWRNCAATLRARRWPTSACKSMLRAKLYAPSRGAAELGQAAQARVRDRHGALPELRRRVQDNRADP